MNSSFFQHAKETFIQLVKVSFPLILLAAILALFDTGVLWGGFIAIILTAIEIRIIMKSTIPWASEVFSVLLSNSGIPGEEDTLVEAATHFKEQGDIQGLVQALRRYTNENPKLLRAWLLRTSFLCDDPINKYDEAITALREALVAARWKKEDKAMLLFKIAQIYELHLGNAQKASAYYASAAQKYPFTAYGKQASERLNGIH